MNSLVCLVSKAAEITLDAACSAALGLSSVAAWRLGEIHSAFSNVHTLSDYGSAVSQSAFLTVIDAFLLPTALFVALSPIRWPLLQLAFSSAFACPNQYNSWNFRGQLFSCAFGALWDIFGYPFGLLALCSPFGRVVTIWHSTNYHFRPLQNFEEKCNSLNHWSTMLISQGLATILDILTVTIALPCILLVPTVWTPTYKGLVDMHLPNNMPSELARLKCYQRVWMEEYYAPLRCHLGNQIFHAFLDVLLVPFYVVVFASPLRRSELRRIIERISSKRLEEEERIASGTCVVSFAPDVSDLDYYYSFALRGDLCVLAMLTIADLLMLHRMLPAWTAQYRFSAST